MIDRAGAPIDAALLRRATPWWMAAASLVVVSLGMPWRASAMVPLYNVYNPWNCGVDWGGEDWASTQWCFQSMPTYSWYQGQAMAGFQMPIRVLVALAAVALLVGVRRARPRPILLGAAIATVGAAFALPLAGPGPTVYLLGVAALWVGVRRAGVTTARWNPRRAQIRSVVRPRTGSPTLR